MSRYLRRVALVVTLAACARGDDRGVEGGSTVTVLIPGNESTMHTDSPQFLVFLPLVARNSKGEPEPRLAKSWEHSPDYREWTVHLRTDVRWHDGKPVTAQDAAFTLGLIRSFQLQGAPVYSFAVLDDSTYTIRYHRRGPASPLDDWSVVLPRHLLQDLDPAEYTSWDFWNQPVGNGPYRFVRRVPNTAMVFEANADYYRGRPRIDRVIVKFAVEPSLTELISGNVDAVMYADRGKLLQLRGDRRYREYFYSRAGVFTALYWNHRHEFFGDARVRRALTLAIDRRELHRAANLPPDTPVFDVIYTERQFDRGELPPALPYDTAGASRLLDEAGWRDRDGDGIRDREGRPFRFKLLMMTGGWAAGTSRRHAALFAQSQLRRVGIQMEIQTMDMSAGRDRWRRGEFDAAIVTSLGGESGNGTLFGSRSLIGYANEKVSRLLGRAATSMNSDERDSIYRELWPIFQNEIPMTPLFPALWTFVAHRRIRGLSSPHRADPLWYMEDLWVEDGAR